MNLLLIDTIHPFFFDRMKHAGVHITDATSWSQDEILKNIHVFEAILIRSRIPINEELFNKANKLRLIARAGSGMENIDVAEAHRRNITCINAPEGNANAVAEHALAMLLALLNNILVADNQIRNNLWYREANRGTELQGKTVAIIGFGNTGSAFARLLQSFNVKILALDKYITIDKNLYPYINQVNWTDVFSFADVVSLHLPLTGETSGLANDAFFNSFQKPICFINTSRGKVASTEAIVNALKAKKLNGACLDVFDFENSSFEETDLNSNPHFNYLRQSQKVILTPHIAGWSHESNHKIASVLSDKIIHWLHTRS
jgi:D-3-phosphoglycerate dehydrogenase